MISQAAQTVKQEMSVVVTLKRELAALEAEWSDLLTLWEDSTGSETALATARELAAVRTAVRRRLAAHQLRNWARIGRAGLTPLQQRIFRLRYVQGCSWSEVVARIQKAKQYLLREHNKGLEVLAQAGPEPTDGAAVPERAAS